MGSARSTNPRLGRYVETVAFDEKVPSLRSAAAPAEPADPAGWALSKLSEADRAIGRLDGIAVMLPRKELFLYMYMRKEAVLSSQIEGTQSTLDDLLRFESEAAAGAPIDDVREVSNYVDAMMHGLERITELPLSLSLRLIRELHARLLKGARGATKNRGEFRTSQNWIGGTRPGNAAYVPPPVSELMNCLDAFEKFMHDKRSGLPPLVKAGLLHVQFESIHPFLDGNGRLGRLLITLFLCAHGILQQPLLYLSLYFKTHHSDYYRLLQEVRERGAWEAWLEFFLDGVAQTANQAFDAAGRIVAVFKEDRERISAADRAGTVLRIHELLQASPYATQKMINARTGLSHPTVNSCLSDLQTLGIIEEITGRKRERVYAYRPLSRHPRRRRGTSGATMNAPRHSDRCPQSKEIASRVRTSICPSVPCSTNKAGLPRWVHRPLPRAPRPRNRGAPATRAGPSHGLRGQAWQPSLA